MRQIKLFSGTKLIAKFTVEEIDDNFISTVWIVDDFFEVDRNVKDFETYSAALANMYKNALEFTIANSDLEMIADD